MAFDSLRHFSKDNICNFLSLSFFLYLLKIHFIAFEVRRPIIEYAYRKRVPIQYFFIDQTPHA